MNDRYEMDDLELIKGIGKATAQVLHELGLARFADLAAETPEGLLEKLKTRLPSIALRRADPAGWIRQAAALAADRTPPPPASNDKAAEGTAGKKQPPSLPPRRGWREIADFFVSFGYQVDEGGNEQPWTRAYYSQGDREAEWPGLANGDLLAWMHSQADLPAPFTPPPKDQIPEPAAAPRSKIPKRPAVEPVEEPNGASDMQSRFELLPLWVSQAPVTAASRARASGGSEGPLVRVESAIRLAGARPSRQEKPPEFTSEVYLVDLETNESYLMGFQSGRLNSSSQPFPVQYDFPMPPVGRYQVFLAAQLLVPGSPAAHVQGPVLEVEP